MPNNLHKSFHSCISKLKKLAEIAQTSPSTRSSSWLLSVCKQPKTPSFAVSRNDQGGRESATLEDIDRFLFENFNSLYQNAEECNSEHEKSVVVCESPAYNKTPPSLHLSHQLFVPTGEPSSLEVDVESSSSSSLNTKGAPPPIMSNFCHPDNEEDENNSMKLPRDTYAMLQYSRDPYNDFRRSMVAVVEAHESMKSDPLDSDFFKKLLFSYLNRNDEKAHKYILGALVDLMAGFRQEYNQISPAIHESRGRKMHLEKEKGREVMNCEGRRRNRKHKR